MRLLDFPFANIELYSEEFALDEDKKEQLTDVTICGVTNIENTHVLDMLQGSSILRPHFLDTLALLPEEDTALQYQTLREAGFNEDQIAKFQICLFKRPVGYVRYQDDDLGGAKNLEPVRGMQVWGLVFGIPLHTYTDGNGYYCFPWRFSAGTIMGTHAKNDRVNVKPLNTVGGFFQTLGQLLVNFVVGSVHVRGFVSSCDMRGEVNFNFTEHKQNRYWSILLNAYYFHDIYAAQDGILNAPQSMVCYAQWSEVDGSASTTKLYHLTGGQFTDSYLQWIFGNPVTGALARVLHGLLPDMSFRVSGTRQPRSFCSVLTQTAFHELGHASMYRKVGAGWHLALDWAELQHVGNNGYGDGNYSDDGKVQVGESWAEFIGTDNANRRYGTRGEKFSIMLGWVNFPDALEREDWFTNRWIPTGFFNDLVDVNNTNTIVNENTWDQIGGSNIHDMYDVFNSNTNSMCDYSYQFISAYPSYNQPNFYTLFYHYITACP